MRSKKTCCLAGPRPSALPFGDCEEDPRCVQLIQAMERYVLQLIHDGTEVFLCGLSQGVDTYFAEIILRLKKQYPNIMLKCVLANESVPDYWIECDRERYYRILEQSDEEIYISRAHTQESFTKRNSYLIMQADQLFVVCSQLSGGIREIIRMALNKNIMITILNIDDLSLQYITTQKDGASR